MVGGEVVGLVLLRCRRAKELAAGVVLIGVVWDLEVLVQHHVADLEPVQDDPMGEDLA